MNIVKSLKKIPIINYIKNKKSIYDFTRDKKFYLNNCINSKRITKEKVEYEMILEVHRIEKGFSCLNQRPFGIDKINRIIELIDIFCNKAYEKSFAYNLSISTLVEYKKLYEEKGWIDREEYFIVKKYLEKNFDYEYVRVGAFDLYKNDFIEYAKIDYDKFLSSRRSVRNFSNQKLKEKDIIKSINMAIKTPTACNRQMCKIYYIEDELMKKNVESFALGLGLFELDNANYFLVTFDVSANYYVGERNQGWFNAGLVSMNFVNALHSLGIGSCCIQVGNRFDDEQKLKKILNISDSERIAVIITAGYYADISRIPFSTRKSIEDIYIKR